MPLRERGYFWCEKCEKFFEGSNRWRHNRRIHSTQAIDARAAASVEDITNIFRKSSVSKAKPELLELMSTGDWSTISSMTDDCKLEWRRGRTDYPEMVRSEACWEGKQPSQKDIFQRLEWLQAMGTGGTVHCSNPDVQDPDLSDAKYQLVEPDPLSTVYAIDLEPEPIPGVNMHIPQSIGLHRPTDGLFSPMTANLTPTYTVVAPHLDSCRDVLSQILRGKKIFLMWPSSDYNLVVLSELARRRPTNRRMRGGIMVLLDGPSHALALYNGTIHSTITISGGVLVGVTWIAATAYRAGIRTLAWELETRIEEDLGGIIGLHVKQVDMSLTYLDGAERDHFLRSWVGRMAPAILHWVEASGTELSENENDSLRSLVRVFKRHSAGERHKEQKTMCCDELGGFEHHFVREHLLEFERSLGGNV